MTSYTRTTRAWLEQRFLMRSEAGHYFAHMPIYGVGHPDAEPGHAARLCRISRILRVLDGLAFDTMLDVGGAEGYLGHLAQTIFGVEAATSDLSLEANRRAREIFALPSAAVDCSRLPFADDAFDVVVCSEVIEHVEHPVETMLELCRVARQTVVLTTEEVRYDRNWIDDYLFKRPGWPHMERNLFHPDDFAACLPGATMTPQMDRPPTDQPTERDATEAWILATSQSDRMAEPAIGVVVTAPQAHHRSRDRQHGDEALLQRLLATTVPSGHRSPPPSAARMARFFATLRDPETGAELRRDGDALHGSRSYPVVDEVPDFFVDVPDAARERLVARTAQLPSARRDALLELRDRLFLPDRWTQDHFDLRQRDQRRGFWPNEQLVPRQDAGEGFCWQATDNDPWVVTPCLMRPVRAIELELRVHAPEHGTDALTGQVFFKGAEQQTFTEECSVKFPLSNDGQLRTVRVVLSGNEHLPDEVQWLRLDLADAACQEIDLLSLRLL
jgi:SAM-dependent methyltransferase